MKTTAPMRAAALLPGLCSRRQRSTAQQNAHDHALELRIVAQEVAQPLGHADYPLPLRQRRQHVIA